MGVDLRYFRSVDDDGRETAAADVIAWGFQRDLEEGEVEYSSWVRFGDDAVIWFSPGLEPGTLCVNGCAKESARGGLMSDRVLGGICVLAEILGATRLYGLTINPANGKENEAHTLYKRTLHRNGWESCEYGYYKELGG